MNHKTKTHVLAFVAGALLMSATYFQTATFTAIAVFLCGLLAGSCFRLSRRLPDHRMFGEKRVIEQTNAVEDDVRLALVKLGVNKGRASTAAHQAVVQNPTADFQPVFTAAVQIARAK